MAHGPQTPIHWPIWMYLDTSEAGRASYCTLYENKLLNNHLLPLTNTLEPDQESTLQALRSTKAFQALSGQSHRRTRCSMSQCTQQVRVCAARYSVRRCGSKATGIYVLQLLDAGVAVSSNLSASVITTR